MMFVNRAPAKNEENDGFRLFITALITTIAAGLFVLSRYVKRICYDASFGVDDAVIGGALVWCLSVSTMPLAN